MDEEYVVDVERKLIGRIPYRYELSKGTTTLEADSGFGRLGAKMDPRTGALMYDRFEDWITKERVHKEEVKKANIRFSAESGAMVQLEEEESVQMSLDGEVRGHETRGVLSVLNRSDKDRIWDVDVGVQEGSGAAKLDFTNLRAKEIEPGKKVSKSYQILLDEPSIALEEVVTTHADLNESRIILKGRPGRIIYQMGIKDLAIIPYSDVVITKPLPPQLKNIAFGGEAREDAAIEEGKLVWRVKRIEPGEMRLLRVEGDLEQFPIEKIPAGDITIKAKGEDIITEIVVNSFDAMCRNMYFIEADETDEPGEWICRFVVENTSLFEVEVMRVEVQDPATGQVYLNLEKTGIYVPPQGRWESDSWLLSRSEKPQFVKNLILNIVPGLQKTVTYQLRREGGHFYPAGLAFKKTIDKSRVEARRDTEVNVQLTIENTGAADIEQVFVRDTLPKYMLPPVQGAISVERNGMPLRDNIGTHLDPGMGDGSTVEQFYVRIDDLSKHGGVLKPGDKVIVRYRSVVHRPEPGEKIVAPSAVDARTLLPGPVITAEDVAGAPVIDTMQILRRFSVGKSIEQSLKVGEYRIELLYRNRGNNPVLDLTLRDIVPQNFVGKDFTLTPAREQTPEGITVLEWKIDKVQPGQSLVITYLLAGEGEYRVSDAQIFYNA